MTIAAISDLTRPSAVSAARLNGRAEDFTQAMATAEAADAAEEDARAAAEIAAAERAVAAFDLSRPTDPANAATYAEGARQVSIAQGLPAGIHDFTRITPRQMSIVGGALIAGGSVGAKGLAGALDLAERDAGIDTPINYFAYLNHEAAANEKKPGGMETSFRQRASLAVLTRVQSAQGVPIRYDDAYPTAPRPMTAEEANAKLKAAITAFRKEASLTPAQRIRRDVLKDMKLTEDTLKAMSPAEREVAEKAISEEVRRRLELLGLSGTGAMRSTDASAASDEKAAAAA